MTKSKNYGFNLPSRDTDDIADINQITKNFEIIDKELYAVSAEAREAGGTAEEARGYAARAYELVGEKAPSIVCQASGDVITLSDSSDLPLRDLKVYGKTTQASTPSPENPQALESPMDVTAKVMGANILDVNNASIYTNSTSTAFDISAVNNGFRVEAVSEVSNTSARRGYYIGTKQELMGKTITVSAKYTTSRTGSTAIPSICLYSLSVPQGYIGNTTTTPQLKLAQIENAPLTFAIDDSCPYDYIGVLFLYSYGGAWGVGGWSQYDDIQVQIGDTATPFEPYTEQTLALPILNEVGLAGVPVASGGNYTGANGQQWICDEIDFARGVYVQRCKEIIYSNEEITEPYMSTTGELTEGAKVLYVLAEPVETPLDEETLSAFSALHTNKPNTTILNDSGVWMSTEYVADTKLYIDNKFAELAKAIVSNS